MELKLNVEEQYLATFVDFIKTLSYVKIEDTVTKSQPQESIAEGFRRAAQDAEMFAMVEEGIEDYAKLIAE